MTVLSLWGLFFSEKTSFYKDVTLNIFSPPCAAFSAFLENFNYVDSSGKRKGLSFFRNRELSEFLEKTAKEIFDEITQLSISSDIDDEERVSMFLNYIEQSVKDVKAKRLELGPEKTEEHRSSGFDYITITYTRYHTAYPPGTFEKQLTAALSAMQSHVDQAQKETIDRMVSSAKETQAPIYRGEKVCQYGYYIGG